MPPTDPLEEGVGEGPCEDGVGVWDPLPVPAPVRVTGEACCRIGAPGGGPYWVLPVPGKGWRVGGAPAAT